MTSELSVLGEALTVQSFISEIREEYDELNKTRRPGRPASVKEVSLKTRIDSLEAEFEGGFCKPTLIMPSL